MSIFRKEFVEHRRIALDFGEPLYDVPGRWVSFSATLSVAVIIALFFGLGRGIPAIVSVVGTAKSTQAVADVPSPKSGFVQEIHYDDEAFVEAGSPIITIFTGGSLSEGSDAKVENLLKLHEERALYEDELSILDHKQQLQSIDLQTRTEELLVEKAQAESKITLVHERLESAITRLEEAELDLSEGLIARASVYSARDLVGGQKLLLLDANSELTGIEAKIDQLNREYDVQHADLALRRISVAQIISQISQREADLQADMLFAVTAQNSGRLGLLSIKQGEPVEKDQPLFRVVTPYTSMNVAFGIPSELAKSVTIGDTVQVSITSVGQDRNKEIYKAEITRIADVATIDPISGENSVFQAEATIDIVPVRLNLSAPQLRDGMKLDVKINGPTMTLWEMVTDER